MTKKITYSLYLPLILTPTISIAAEFSWRSQEYPYRGEHPTPLAACQSILTGVFSYPVHFVSLNRYSDTLWTCAVVDDRAWSGNPVQYRSIQRLGNECKIGAQFNTGTGHCEFPSDAPDRKKMGTPPNFTCQPSLLQGNPINIANGNKFQAEIDTESPFKFTRYFNSINGTWGHTYSIRLLIGDISLAIVRPDGRQILFKRNGNIALAEEDEVGSLLKSATGWKYSSADGQFYEFDNSGQLTAWIQENNARQTIQHNGGNILITNDRGENMTLVIDLPTYQVISLEQGAFSTTYSYTNGKLTKVTKARQGESTSRLYHYESQKHPNALTGITNEIGIKSSKWLYDDNGRAISSEHANGTDKVSVTYNSNGSSTVINEYGRKTHYQFQQIQGTKYITSIVGEATPECPYSNSTFTYSNRGLLKTKTDAKGNLTTYDYNTRGLETSRTEASGTPQVRTITTEWHPTLFLKTKVTEPSRITTYQYDAQGRQTGQIVTPR